MEQQSLKTKKNNNRSMSKILKPTLSIFFLLIIFSLFFNMVSAIDIFSTNTLDLTNNLTTKLFYSITYSSTNYDDVLNQPYESYVLYSSNVGDWNTANTQNQVRDCNLSIYYSSYRSQLLHQGNLSAPFQTLIYNNDFTGNSPINKYFVRLNPQDVYTAQITCTFVSPEARTLDIPVTMSIVTPTWECLACQYYQWTQDQIKLKVATRLGDYTTRNVGYISGLFKIFYDIAIYAFWVGLILLLILSISLIFYIVYFIYSYLMKMSRQI